MSAAAPRVSVVLPTYNRAALLARSAGSVLKQTFTDLELLLVDDGSEQDIRAVAEGFGDSRVRYLRRDRRGGPPAARNTGLAAARGEYVAFQDSDDEWLLDKLAAQVRALDGAADFELCICGLLRAGGSSLQAYLYGPGEAPTIDYRTALVNPTRYVHPQCWLARRAVLQAEGGFDESLFLWDDWEFLIRLTRRRPALALAQALVISTKSVDSITNVNPEWARHLGLIVAKHAAALAGYPRELARLRYLHARYLSLEGKIVPARQSLLRALRLNPRDAKAWALLAAGFAGPGAARRILQ